MSDQGYRASFDFNKSSTDSMIDCANTVRAKFAGQPMPELTPDEDRQLRTVMAQLAVDNSGDRDVAVTREVDRALLMVREKILSRMGVDIRSINMSPLEAMGVEQMDIEAGDEDEMDDPSAFHMDMDSLGERLEGTQPPEECDMERVCGKFASRETVDKVVEFEEKHGAVLLLKVIGSSLNRLLVAKGVVTEEELVSSMVKELEETSVEYDRYGQLEGTQPPEVQDLVPDNPCGCNGSCRGKVNTTKGE
jgi:hypothetical protein